MRLLSSVLGAVLVAVAAVLLTLFALENTQVVSLSFLGAHFSGNIWWLVLGAAAIGFLLALILLAPGHMVASSRAYNLSQVNAQHEQDLADLQATHAQLQAERDRMTAQHASVANELHTLRDDLVAARSDRDEARRERDQLRAERDQLEAERERVVAERDQLRERLAASPAVAPASADGYRATVEPALMGAATPVAADQMASQHDISREDQAQVGAAPETPMQPVAPTESEDHTEPDAAVSPVPAGKDQVVAREPADTQPAQPTLGERLRAMVTGQSVDEVQAHDAQRDETRADVPPQMQADTSAVSANQPVELPPEQPAESPEQPTA